MIFQIFFFLIGIYYFITSVFGLAEKIYGKASKNYLPIKKFAVFIPAHNEEIVIENIVDNLKQLNYPKDSYDIYVIADNCTDNTAAAARAAGANVLERNDNKKRGKGYALQWAFEKVLYDEGSDYDGAVIFDADNLVSMNFLREMNNKLCDGHKVIQGYIDSKNPNDTWITASYSIAFWSTNRLFQCARSFLGMSCEI
ncbi:MAG TPA: glycosyltransferase family 2 protein, partial [Bacillota bacterium]|nr:glycosyltransferase family 2 protein [Bacillota bacterium]